MKWWGWISVGQTVLILVAIWNGLWKDKQELKHVIATIWIALAIWMLFWSAWQ